MNPVAVSWIMIPMLVAMHASLCDIRSREVSDIHWLVMGSVGIVLRSVVSADSAVTGATSVAGSLILLVCMLSERIVGWRAAVAAAVGVTISVVPAVADPGDVFATSVAVSAAMFLLLHGMYLVGLIPGGADAKFLMTVALVFPVYPVVGGIPMMWVPEPPISYLVNPAVSVLVLGLVLSILSCPAILIRNLRRGDTAGRVLTTYRMSVEEARGAFVWPVEEIRDGALVPCHSYDRREKVLDALSEAGVAEVRVTPMVPFILPLTVALMLVTVLGSPLPTVIGGRCRWGGRRMRICRSSVRRCRRGTRGA